MIVGGGPSGLAAALAAVEEGKQVLLLDDNSELGGHSLHSIAQVDNCKKEKLNGFPEYQAIQKLIDELLNFRTLGNISKLKCVWAL
ncbi:MAG: hypothetical protein CM1200mP30_32400 [Pseudomonadota bacterium]|nr:MAG: hypothetical protein CM1200mP30_32400 [Pseudomonadota bacterium]